MENRECVNPPSPMLRLPQLSPEEVLEGRGARAMLLDYLAPDSRLPGPLITTPPPVPLIEQRPDPVTPRPRALGRPARLAVRSSEPNGRRLHHLRISEAALNYALLIIMTILTLLLLYYLSAGS